MRKLLLLFILAFSQAAMAYNNMSFGSVAQNITDPMEVVSAFFSMGALLVGVGCIFASIVKYFEHRRSPLYVPMSTVVWLLIIGLLLLILPFAYMITESGIPFNSFWGGSQ